MYLTSSPIAIARGEVVMYSHRAPTVLPLIIITVMVICSMILFCRMVLVLVCTILHVYVVELCVFGWSGGVRIVMHFGLIGPTC